MKRYIRSDKTSTYRKLTVRKIIADVEIQHDEDWERRLEEKLNSAIGKHFTPEEAIRFMKEVGQI